MLRFFIMILSIMLMGCNSSTMKDDVSEFNKEEFKKSLGVDVEIYPLSLHDALPIWSQIPLLCWFLLVMARMCVRSIP